MDLRRREKNSGWNSMGGKTGELVQREEGVPFLRESSRRKVFVLPRRRWTDPKDGLLS
jgi:hypothetical protein